MLTYEWRCAGTAMELWLQEDQAPAQNMGSLSMRLALQEFLPLVGLIEVRLQEYLTIEGALPELAQTPLRGGRVRRWRLWDRWGAEDRES